MCIEDQRTIRKLNREIAQLKSDLAMANTKVDIQGTSFKDAEVVINKCLIFLNNPRYMDIPRLKEGVLKFYQKYPQI